MVGLDLGKPEALDQPGTGLGIIARGADDGDDLVDIVEGNDETLEDVSALFGLAQLVTCAALDDVDLVVDVVIEHVLEAQREVIDAEARL